MRPPQMRYCFLLGVLLILTVGPISSKAFGANCEDLLFSQGTNPHYRLKLIERSGEMFDACLGLNQVPAVADEFAASIASTVEFDHVYTCSCKNLAQSIRFICSGSGDDTSLEGRPSGSKYISGEVWEPRPMPGAESFQYNYFGKRVSTNQECCDGIPELGPCD